MRTPYSALSLGPVIGDMLGRWRYGYLLESLIMRELRVKYRRSVLGVVWTLITPIMMMVIFTVVFSHLFAATLPHFAVYFLSAYLGWQFFTQTTTQAMISMLRSASLYKRIYVPKYVFVLATVCANLLALLIALIPLAGLILLIGHPITPAILWLPLSLLILATFTTGVSLWVATIAVFLEDVVQFYPIILQALMYLTVIFYPVTIIPPALRWLVYLNPMYYCVQMMRYPLYDGQAPPPVILLGSIAWALLALAVGGRVFARASDRFAYYV
jgi:ABC-2 type transport system permease protein